MWYTVCAFHICHTLVHPMTPVGSMNRFCPYDMRNHGPAVVGYVYILCRDQGGPILSTDCPTTTPKVLARISFQLWPSTVAQDGRRYQDHVQSILNSQKTYTPIETVDLS